MLNDGIYLLIFLFACKLFKFSPTLTSSLASYSRELRVPPSVASWAYNFQEQCSNDSLVCFCFSDALHFFIHLLLCFCLEDGGLWSHRVYTINIVAPKLLLERCIYCLCVLFLIFLISDCSSRFRQRRH